MRDPSPTYFVWEPFNLPIYPYKMYYVTSAS